MRILILLILSTFACAAQPTSGGARETLNIDSLLSLPVSAVSSGQSVIVKYRSTTNDNGGGVFVYQPLSTDSTNLGTTFKPITANGRWIRQYSDSLNVLWFGAPSGTNDYSFVVQNALDTAKRTGARSVLVPPITATFTNTVNVWSGVALSGSGGSIFTRGRFLFGNTNTCAITGMNYMANVYTGSSVEGIMWNDNKDAWTIPSWPQAYCDGHIASDGYVTQTQYGCLFVIGGLFDYGPDGNTPIAMQNSSIRISNNTFLDASGAFIKNGIGQNAIVSGNFFGDYNDHSVYFSGFPPDDPADNLIISKNIFSSLDSVRGNVAVKFRNFTSRALVTGNVVDVPEDTFLGIDVGDVSGSSANGPIVSSANSGRAESYIYMTGDTTPNGLVFQSTGNNLVVSNYVVIGSFASADAYPSGSISFSSDKFYAADQTHNIIVAAGGNPTTGISKPTDYSFKGCSFYGLFGFYLFGYLSLDFSGNTIWNLNEPDGANNPALFTVYEVNGLTQSTTNLWNWHNNIVYNYSSLYFEPTDSNTNSGNTFGLDAASMRFSENKMFGHPSRNWVLDMRGNAVSNYTGLNAVTLSGNLVTDTLVSPTTSVPESKIFKQNTVALNGTDIGSEEVVINNSDSVAKSLIYQNDGIRRWALQQLAISGSFALNAFDGAGVFSYNPMTVTTNSDWTLRGPSIGLVTPLSALIGSGSGTALQIRDVSGSPRSIQFLSGSNTDWSFREDSDDNLSFSYYDGAGSYVGDALSLSMTNGYVHIGASTGPAIMKGSGSPEGVVAGNIGWLYLRTDGTTNTTLYYKTSDNSTSNWVPVADTGGSGGSGSVTNLSVGNLSPFWSANVADPTTNPDVTYANSDPGFPSVHGWDDVEGAAKQLALTASIVIDAPTDALELDGDDPSPSDGTFYGKISGNKGWFSLTNALSGVCVSTTNITASVTNNIFSFVLTTGATYGFTIEFFAQNSDGDEGVAVGKMAFTVSHDADPAIHSEQVSFVDNVGDISGGIGPGIFLQLDQIGNVGNDFVVWVQADSSTATTQLFSYTIQTFDLSVSASPTPCFPGLSGGGSGGGGSAPTGTIINSGGPAASTDGAIPYFTGTTGTNALPSGLIVSASTNLSVGNVTIEGAALFPGRTLAYTGGTNVLVDLSTGSMFGLTLTNTAFIIFTNVPTASYQTVCLQLLQDGTGGRSVSWFGNAKFPYAGLVPTITTNANAHDVLTFMRSFKDSTNMLGVPIYNFQ